MLLLVAKIKRGQTGVLFTLASPRGTIAPPSVAVERQVETQQEYEQEEVKPATTSRKDVRHQVDVLSAAAPVPVWTPADCYPQTDHPQTNVLAGKEHTHTLVMVSAGTGLVTADAKASVADTTTLQATRLSGKHASAATVLQKGKPDVTPSLTHPTSSQHAKPMPDTALSVYFTSTKSTDAASLPLPPLTLSPKRWLKPPPPPSNLSL